VDGLRLKEVRNYYFGCARCRPALAPTDNRSVGRFAVRFGDLRLEVLRDGEAIDGCYEVDTHSGTAWRWVRPLRHCTCGSRLPMAFLDKGRFTVAAELPANDQGSEMTR
jgi:hypothetical protein